MIGCTVSWLADGTETERTYCLLEPDALADGNRLHRVTYLALCADPYIDDVLAAFGLVFARQSCVERASFYAEKESP